MWLHPDCWMVIPKTYISPQILFMVTQKLQFISVSHFRMVFTSQCLQRHRVNIHPFHQNMKSIMTSGTIHLYYITSTTLVFIQMSAPLYLQTSICVSGYLPLRRLPCPTPPPLSGQVRVLSGLAGRGAKLSILSDCILPRLVFISTPSQASQT